MLIHQECRQCQATVGFPPEKVGFTGRCPQCQSTFAIEAPRTGGAVISPAGASIAPAVNPLPSGSDTTAVPASRPARPPVPKWVGAAGAGLAVLLVAVIGYSLFGPGDGANTHSSSSAHPLFSSGKSTSAGTTTTTVAATSGDGKTFNTAFATTVPATGAFSAEGNIGRPGDAQFYRFVSPASGALTVRQEAVPGSNLDSLVFIYDSARSLIGQDDDGAGSLNSLYKFQVNSGQTYFVKSAAYVSKDDKGKQAEKETGRYKLTLSIESGATTTANSFATARLIELNNLGDGSAGGNLERAGEAQYHKFVARHTGSAVIKQIAAPGSPLDSHLTTYDSDQKVLAQDDDSEGSLNSRVTIPITIGRTYFLKSAALETANLEKKTGRYTITITISKITPASTSTNTSLATAQTISLNAAGDGSQAGQIERAGEALFYRFTANQTGSATIKQIAAAGSPLDSHLTLYDGDQKVLAQDDDSEGSLNSRVTLPLTSGRTYFLKCGALDSANPEKKVGRFTVSILMSRTISSTGASTFATAQPVELPPGGAASVEGNIVKEGEGHFYRIEPKAGGKLIIRQAAGANSMLDSLLSVYGTNQIQLASNDDDPLEKSSNSRVEVPVTAGTTYYIRAGNYNNQMTERRVGRYTLTITLTK